MARKLFRRLIIISAAFINLCSLPLILFLMILFRMSAFLLKKKHRPYALFSGLDHLIEKTEVRMGYLRTHGIESICFVSNVKKQKERLYHTKKIILINIIKFSIVFFKYRPLYMEIYYDGNSINQFIFLWISRSTSMYSVSVMRGELYYYSTSMLPIKKFFVKKTMRASDAIYYRELYMKDIIRNEIGIQDEKVYFDPNKVKISDWFFCPRNDKQVLFLNGFKSWRRLELIIDAIKIVNKIKPDIRFKLVGARSESELNYYKEIIKTKGIQNTELFYWTDQPRLYYERASLFVLPADLVFLNFSLLEAMERGVPAIIAKVDDADKIIDHGCDGFIVNQDAASFARFILVFFNDTKVMEKMSRAARKKVIERFDDSKRMDRIIAELKKRNHHIIGN